MNDDGHRQQHSLIVSMSMLIHVPSPEDSHTMRKQISNPQLRYIAHVCQYEMIIAVLIDCSQPARESYHTTVINISFTR
jgi:hypothetical protein